MIYSHTIVARAKIAITLDQAALSEIDRLVRQGVYPNRSQAIEAAVEERLNRIHRSRLAAECAKLNKFEEQDWPDY
jgi:Arc/MetJ-type ribon-helix-helix transcriptional regulator